MNENDKLGIVGQITNVTSDSQRDALNARALTLLNSELGQDEAIELMLVKSPDFQSLLFEHRSRLAVAAQKGAFLIRCSHSREWSKVARQNTEDL